MPSVEVTAWVVKQREEGELRNDPEHKKSLADNPKLQSEEKTYQSMLTGDMCSLLKNHGCE